MTYWLTFWMSLDELFTDLRLFIVNKSQRKVNVHIETQLCKQVAYDKFILHWSNHSNRNCAGVFAHVIVKVSEIAQSNVACATKSRRGGDETTALQSSNLIITCTWTVQRVSSSRVLYIFVFISLFKKKKLKMFNNSDSIIIDDRDL